MENFQIHSVILFDKNDKLNSKILINKIKSKLNSCIKLKIINYNDFLENDVSESHKLQMLFHTLEYYTSFPISYELIILQNVNFSLDKRIYLEEILSLQRYNLIKDFNLQKLETLSCSFTEYSKYFLEYNSKYYIFGDLNSKFDLFNKCLNNLKFTKNSTNCKIILCGNWIKKDSIIKQEDYINFLYEIKEKVVFLKSTNEEFIKETILFKKKLKPVETKFLELYNKSLVFVKLDSVFLNKKLKNNFIITSAPCVNKFLGKIDNYSLNKQQFFIKNSEVDDNYLLNLIKKESNICNYLHVFGCLNLQDTLYIHNKIGLNTNKISYVLLNPINKFFIKSRELVRHAQIP
jgi:hypothetical protein